MSGGIMLQINDNGKASLYDDTYDITIHCETEEDQKRAIEKLNSMRWIPVEEKLPDTDEDGYSKKLLVSFSNASDPEIGEYREHDEKGTGFYCGDMPETFSEYGLEVNAWMPLPKCYRKEEGTNDQHNRHSNCRT